MRRVYAYLLHKRHIEREVVSYFTHEKLLYEDEHHNCVFVGMDGDIAKHAHLRSTNSEGKVFRMNVEGSESAHSFHKDGTDKSLYVFEAPIDLLSHITLEMSRNVQSGNTQNLKSMVIQRSFPKWSVAERRKTAAASDQAAVCACARSRYFAGGSPSGLRV